MKRMVAALMLTMVLAATAQGGWYVGPTVVQAYYPVAPVYAYPTVIAPVYAPAPYVAYSPVVPAPVVAPAAVWVGAPAVVVRGKVYIPGRPMRNVVRAVVP